MKIVLVSEIPIFLEGLQCLLEKNGIEVAGLAYNGREAVSTAKALKPDVILMDIKIREFGGIDALKQIKAEMPNIKVVMFNITEGEEDPFEAVRYGASGFLLKNANTKVLMNLLFDLEKGKPPLSTYLAAKLSSECEGGHLTYRQWEVLEMVAKGKTYKEVGETLGLTERTVKYHMGRIIDRMHLENRAQVIAYAAQIGLIEI